MAYRTGLSVFILCLMLSLPAVGKAAEFDPLSDGMDDTVAMFTAPVSWEAKDWTITGIGIGAVVASGAIWDNAMFGQWRGNNSGLADFGNAWAYAGPAAAMLFYGGAAMLGDNEDALNTSWEVGEAAVLSVLLTGIFKAAVGRERPNIQGNNSTSFHPGSFSDAKTSFPSGHTALAFSLAAVLQDTDLPVYLKAIPFALAGVTAWARVHDDRHWVSDTVAGALIGYGVGRFVVRRNAERGVNIGYILPQVHDRGWGIAWVRTF